jgi:hypothetical protein
MAFNSSITAMFGGDTTNLRASTEEASIMVKGFGREASMAIRDIGAGFVGAVVIMEAVKAIKELGAAAIESAEKERELADATGGAVTDQSQAWLDLADSSTSFWSEVKIGATEALTQFLLIGEGIKSAVLSMEGASTQEQNLFDKIGNSAEVNIARAKAASDKFLAELPQKQAEANAKLEQLDQQYAASQDVGQDKVNVLTDKYNAILAQIVATNQVIGAQEAAGADASAAKYKLTQEEVELMQTALALQAAQVQAAKDEVQAFNQKFDTEKSSLSIEDQISALKQQQVVYTSAAAAASGNEAQQEVLKNAAAKLGQQIAADTATIQKATALSLQDQLAMFEHQAGSLADLNTLSEDQYNLLVQQQQVKAAQYQVDQDIEAGYTTGTDQNQKDLATHTQKLAVLQQELAVMQQQVQAATDQAAADAAVLAAQQAISAAAQGGPGGMATQNKNGGWDVGSGADMQHVPGTQKPMLDPKTGQPMLDADGNPILDPLSGQFTNADGNGMDGPGFGATTNPVFNPGTAGPGFGDQQLQDQYTQQNNSSYVAQEIKSLQQQLTAYDNSDDSTFESQVPALEKALAALQSPGYSNAVNPLVNPTPGIVDNSNAAQQTKLLQQIQAILTGALGGG